MLSLIDLESTKPIWQTRCSPDLLCLEFSCDGSYLLVGGSELTLYSASSGESLWTRQDYGSIRGARFSSGGHSILLSIAPDEKPFEAEQRISVAQGSPLEPPLEPKRMYTQLMGFCGEELFLYSSHDILMMRRLPEPDYHRVPGGWYSILGASVHSEFALTSARNKDGSWRPELLYFDPKGLGSAGALPGKDFVWRDEWIQPPNVHYYVARPWETASIAPAGDLVVAFQPENRVAVWQRDAVGFRLIHSFER